MMSACGYRDIGFTLAGKLRVGKEERGAAFAAIGKIIALYHGARKNGLLWFEEAAEMERDRFLRS